MRGANQARQGDCFVVAVGIKSFSERRQHVSKLITAHSALWHLIRQELGRPLSLHCVYRHGRMLELLKAHNVSIQVCLKKRL